MLVGGENVLAPGEGADQRKQRGTRQMKICQQALHHTKSKPRNNEQLRIRFATAQKFCAA